jgi:hypothetical protein
MSPVGVMIWKDSRSQENGATSRPRPWILAEMAPPTVRESAPVCFCRIPHCCGRFACAEDDPLMQSIGDYMALLETSYTTSEAAKYLKVDASRVRQRLRERSLYGIDYDGEKRLPRFQFERQQVIPGLREVIAALPQALNPLDVAEWFLSPNPDLEIDSQENPLSPRDWLLSGAQVEAVVALARGFE